MPKTAIDYSKTIMYKIVCKDLNIKDLYVGHTVSFTKRKCKHSSDCSNDNSKGHNTKVYQFIRANGGWNNWQMIEIEKYNCDDGNEARARERYWCEQLQATLNQVCPMRSVEETKTIEADYARSYYHQHKNDEEYQRKRKERNSTKHDCLCGGKYLSKHKGAHDRSQMHQTFLKLQQMADEQII